MKWQLKEPTFGDIIRVKAGSFYHYGIYVSDEEIIQFGLSPIARSGMSDGQIEVCTSNVEGFLLGEFLEVGVCDKKDKRRNSPKQTVAIARSRLGEKGYHILYNNCEHFANECYLGEKYSSQTEDVRELFRNLPVADVYLATLPESEKFEKLYPKARQSEIKAISNSQVKKEKYYVWKLLEHAVKTSFAKKITDLTFEKSPSGKWLCDGCEFSLSHSHNLLCVAVSKAPIGVDVEKIQAPRIDISREILNADELSVYETLEEDVKPKFLIEAWTKKESLFKIKNVKAVSREEFRSLQGNVVQKTVCISGEDYSLSIATSTPDKIKIFESVVLK
ncbi:MAG: lecithin retinol acyltransferase family protein [Clostridia bacterium]|nr:lecithin retinol acyltransferase family protein [Clostridia bacterium]